MTLVLFLSNNLRGQILMVKSMQMDASDLSARTREIKDVYGAACALVKVQLVVNDAKFEGNIIGDVVNKTGEYWVYMTDGSEVLNIKHPNCKNLYVRFADYGIKQGVEGKQTYKLIVSYTSEIQVEIEGLTPEQVLNLGYDYQEGRNGKKADAAKAMEFFRIASDLGNPEAMNSLGSMYIEEQNDYVEANKWYKKAAELGDANAQYNLGSSYFHGKGIAKNSNEAIKWFRKAAMQGLEYAQNDLGIMYRDGILLDKKPEEAVKWFRMAAEQGYGSSQYNLACLYYDGNGVEQDYREAVKWFRKAAEQGKANAQSNLGLMYEYGKGVLLDYGEAIKWYKKAAEQGNAIAQYNLGQMYRKGKGTPVDIATAKYWYEKAAAQGFENAKTKLIELEEKQ